MVYMSTWSWTNKCTGSQSSDSTKEDACLSYTVTDVDVILVGVGEGLESFKKRGLQTETRA